MGDTLELTAAIVLALDTAKRTGDFEPVRQTREYKMMIAKMDAEKRNPHDINVRVLDEVCQQVAARLNQMTPAMRKLAMETLGDFSEAQWK
ncbi:MAG: hypothetical protein ABR988_17090 [Terriglobales bacterium]|jgi:hypothetical protein